MEYFDTVRFYAIDPIHLLLCRWHCSLSPTSSVRVVNRQQLGDQCCMMHLFTGHAHVRQGAILRIGVSARWSSPTMLPLKAMAKRLIVILFLTLVVAGFASYAYDRYRSERRPNVGEIVDETGSSVASQSTLPARTRVRSDTDEFSIGRRPTPAAQSTTAPSSGSSLLDQRPSEIQSLTPEIDRRPSTSSAQAVAAGTGKFELYRQGDLTWRLNTETGSTCILFATEKEWKKPLVYDNACINRYRSSTWK